MTAAEGIEREVRRGARTERPELPPLLDNRVHEGERKQHGLPLGVGDRVEYVLVEPGVRVAHAQHDAGRRLVGELDRELQKADGELGVWLRGDPQAEAWQDGAGGGLLHLGQAEHPLGALAHEGEAEVAVLQQHPDALGDALLEELARRRLLALAHGDAHHGLLALLGEGVDLASRVGAGGEDGDHRHHRVGLVVQLGEVERLDEQVLAAERRGDVRVDGEQRAVLADGAHEKHLFKLVEALVVVGEELRLGRVVVVPRLPLLGVTLKVVWQIAQHLHGARERKDVQPDILRDPLLGGGLL